jgi:hypothetical protein
MTDPANQHRRIGMSGRAMIEFAHALNADGALVNGLIAALGRKEGSDAIGAFVSYARKHGYPVSREDVAALRRKACPDDGIPAENCPKTGKPAAQRVNSPAGG